MPKRFPFRRPLVALACLIAIASPAVMPGRTATASLTFSKPQQLPHWFGGEPSIAFDPDGAHVYVTAPQYLGAAVNSATLALFGLRYPNRGLGFWASQDGGKTWIRNANIGSAFGGGDSDVAVGPDHTVYVDDLQAVANAICTSTDYGQNFSSLSQTDDGCVTLPLNQKGYDSDRQWLNVGPKGDLFLTYHDLSVNLPLVHRSTDRASTFAPCGSIFDPQGPAIRAYDPLLGDLIPKPVIGKDGTMYVEVSIAKGSPDDYRISDFYMAVAEGGCDTTKVFKNYTIYSDPGADFKLFQSVGIDGAGTLYVVGAGKSKASDSVDNVFVFVSRDGGKTWSRPVRVNSPKLTANLMPAIVGGLGAGQVAVGWLGTSTSADAGNGKNQWRYYVATSFDYGKTFSQSTVTPGVIHYGDICVLGIFCGAPGRPANRNLADFTSITVNPKTGCLVIAIPGDPYNRPDQPKGANTMTSSAYLSYQTGGPCMSAKASSKKR